MLAGQGRWGKKWQQFVHLFQQIIFILSLSASAGDLEQDMLESSSLVRKIFKFQKSFECSLQSSTSVLALVL